MNPTTQTHIGRPICVGGVLGAEKEKKIKPTSIDNRYQPIMMIGFVERKRRNTKKNNNVLCR